MSGIKSLPYLDPKRAGYLGLASIAVFIVCWVVGALMDDEWRLFEDSICVLGVSDIMFIRVMYPISCILTGLGLAVFGYSVARSSERRLPAVGYYMCILFCISMLGIGIFNMDDFFDLHMDFVYLLGVSSALVMAPVAMDDFRFRRWLPGVYVVILAIVFLILTLYFVDYQQFFTIVGMFIWVGYKCYLCITTGNVPEHVPKS